MIPGRRAFASLAEFIFGAKQQRINDLKWSLLGDHWFGTSIALWDSVANRSIDSRRQKGE